ncbi:MAG: M23 family metallopeptidase [Lachnospiraceae bacterium]|nr:M23 family metallopeptidase [Lachnospiraceae bacterium]
MKEKVNQMFKDKLTLVMLVLGLLTIVSAAGVMTLRKSRTEESPYLNMEGAPEHLADEAGGGRNAAGDSDAAREGGLSDDGGSLLADGGEGENGNAGGLEAAADDAAEEAGEAAGKAAGANASKGRADDGKAGKRTEKADEAGSLDGDSSLLADSGENGADAAPAGAGADAAEGLMLEFAEGQTMAWPVSGNVLLDYSMDSTIYFPTLEQYKCNPGLVIQSDVSQPVAAPANARVLETGTNEEIGSYVVLDLGDDYALTCGQLKEVQAVKGEYLEKGQVLGYVAEPTKYYTLEGPNVFFKVTKDGKAVDPLDYLE